MSQRTILPLVLLLAVMVLAYGCGPKQPTQDVPTQPPAPAVEAAPAPEPEPIKEVEADFPVEPPVVSKDIPTSWEDVQRVLATVYFDFDKHELDDDDRAALQGNAEVLRENSDFGIVIEGHCDERGTIEYNLTLGERRASSVREYLESLGVSRDRMRIRTYGEEQPASAEHNESAWAKNRRAEFKVEG